MDYIEHGLAHALRAPLGRAYNRTDQLADQGSGAGFGKTCGEKLEQIYLKMDVPREHSVVPMPTNGSDLGYVQPFFKKP